MLGFEEVPHVSLIEEKKYDLWKQERKKYSEIYNL